MSQEGKARDDTVGSIEGLARVADVAKQMYPEAAIKSDDEVTAKDVIEGIISKGPDKDSRSTFITPDSPDATPTRLQALAEGELQKYDDPFAYADRMGGVIGGPSTSDLAAAHPESYKSHLERLTNTFESSDASSHPIDAGPNAPRGPAAPQGPAAPSA